MSESPETPDNGMLRFRGTTQDLGRWFAIIETAATSRGVPRLLWANVAACFLTGDLKKVMMESLRASEGGHFDWDDFKRDLRQVIGRYCYLRHADRLC